MQRVRWASKTTGYRNTYAKLLAVAVLLMNFSLVVGCALCVVGCLNWKIIIVLFTIKYLIDYLIIYKSNRYLRKRKFVLPLASSIIYPVFASVVGLYSLFGNFTWKDRRFSK